MAASTRPDEGLASPLAVYGPRLLQQGYPIVPIQKGTKKVGYKNWQHTAATEQHLRGWLSNGYAQGGVGLLTARHPALDADILDLKLAKATRDVLLDFAKARGGPLPVRIGRSPKTAYLFRAPEGIRFRKQYSAKYLDDLGRENRLELLGDGQQVVLHGLHPDTRQPYVSHVLNHDCDGFESLADVHPQALIEITQADIDYFFDRFEQLAEELGYERVSDQHSDRGEAGANRNGTDSELSGIAYAVPPADVSLGQIRAALQRLDPDQGYARWLEVGQALHHQYEGSVDGLKLWDQWSRKSRHYDYDEIERKWDSFRSGLEAKRPPVTIRSVLKAAKEKPERAARDEVRASEHEPEPRRGFHFQHIDHLLTSITPVAWQIKGVIEANTMGLLFGDPGSYKSFLALDLGLATATGQPWMGRETRPGPVIYIAGEGHGGLKRRIRAWHLRKGPADGAPFYLSNRAASLYETGSVESMIAHINEACQASGAPPAMIIIDTLARNFGAGDENSTQDMNLFVENADALRQHYQCALLLVHHTGHGNKERARGAMALKGGVDFEYRCEVTSSLVVELTCTKMKDAEMPKPMWFRGEVVPLELGFENESDEETTSLVFEETVPKVEKIEGLPELKGRLAEMLRLCREAADEHGQVNRRVLLRLVDSHFQGTDTVAPSRGSVRQWLHRLKQEGYFLPTEEGGRRLILVPESDHGSEDDDGS